jgi:hypothetical protein
LENIKKRVLKPSGRRSRQGERPDTTRFFMLSELAQIRIGAEAALAA